MNKHVSVVRDRGWITDTSTLYCESHLTST